MSVTITAAEINKLRQTTGAGMLDCRKALTETNGDFEAAIDWLRKQGQKVAAKRSDREAKRRGNYCQYNLRPYNRDDCLCKLRNRFCK